MTDLAITEGEGWHIPPTLLPYSDSRFTSTLFKPVTQPLSISNSDAAKLARSFIHCTDKPADWLIGGSFAIQQAGAQARSNGWDYYELPTGHAEALKNSVGLQGLAA